MNGINHARNTDSTAISVSCKRPEHSGWRQFACQVLVAAVVAVVVANSNVTRLEPAVHAEPRRITPQTPDQHFKSGGRMSETVLQEILVVLKRMDERLERIEQSADQIADSGRGRAGGISEGQVNSSQNGASPPAIQVRRGG